MFFVYLSSFLALGALAHMYIFGHPSLDTVNTIAFTYQNNNNNNNNNNGKNGFWTKMDKVDLLVFSPYLFVLVMMALSCLISKTTQEESF